MTLRPLSAAVMLALCSLAAGANANDLRRPYIVQLADKPVASYNGGVGGMAATQPLPGQRLDLASQDVNAYSSYLAQKQSTVQAAVANAPILYNYSVVLNGFTAMLTDDEARQLMVRSDVASVSADTPRQMDTTYTTRFLGLEKDEGLWNQLGGKAGAGENVVIGVIDGGVWPENPAFADRIDSNGRPTFDSGAAIAYDSPPASWKGSCQSGEGFTAANCNNKLIGAQYFDSAFRALTQYSAHWSEFRSPRDSIGGDAVNGGHGTHTASTAGGNSGVDAVVNGVNLGLASGMAPRARIAAYKVCWTYNAATETSGSRNGCFSGDSVAAIEKAVLDGVNVINFSISGSTSLTDPVEQAFLHAANAGVFVAASGGNNGPSNSVGHPSPWVATVAAATHNRAFQAEVTLANGARYTGASLNQVVLPSAPLVSAERAGLSSASATLVSLCFSKATNNGRAVLDPVKVAGKIVTCTRGTNSNTDKSLAVYEAGGVGMVEIDNGAGPVAEAHAVPTVHVSAADGAKIKTYASQSGAMASIGKFVIGASATPAPVVAGFSARGPNRYDASVLKPDLAAPGVDIIAGAVPLLTQQQRAGIVDGIWTPPAAWASYQGTSMATPHVAGIAALLHQEHPAWNPAMIKSALMTSATDTYPDTIASGDTRGILPFGQGAGQINPNGAADPGLVYDIAPADYKRYLCGLAVSTNCADGSLMGLGLNLPSISAANIIGAVTVTRRVTNVGAAAATYTAQVAVPGFDAVVSPATLDIAPSETKSFDVTLTQTSAATNVWQFGKLIWSDGTHVVRSPITARAGKSISAPELVTANRAAATRIVSVLTGFAGKMGVVYGGLKEIVKTADSVVQAPLHSVDSITQAQTACRARARGVRVTQVAIPSGTLLARFELSDRDTGAGNGIDDLDLAVLNSAGSLVAYSSNNGANELADLATPTAGTYSVCVIGYASANGSTTEYALSSAIVGAGDRNGNFRAVAPSQVYKGSTASLGVSWSGLEAGKRYAGAIQMLDASGAAAAITKVLVETNNPVPAVEPVTRPGRLDMAAEPAPEPDPEPAAP
ncbi:S8 family peptidase [Massilia forsythiae]|uniref:S8 family peptidase n=1 Tax=Massilia forsythiae TaxID=2728020 RepID=A0A7Z2ZS76_9BURK|nr:S8 family peptidase [Massilia forsythiae]QJD98766.1 S8 family peptidase [Massilia forsythiae]